MTATPRRQRASSPFLLSVRDRARLDPRSPLAVALQELDSQVGAPAGDVLTRDLPVEISGVRVALSKEQIEHAKAIVEARREKDVQPYAENSVRGMQSDWRHWLAFCTRNGRVAMPISYDDLITFIDALINAGYKRASLEHILFTLAEASRLWGCPNPMDTILWRDFWRDRKRKRLTKRQHQAPSLNIQEVDAVAARVDPEDPRSLRDALFVSCAYDLMARASELVAMTWEGITFEEAEDGGATYLLGDSKTDQDGEGTLLYLQPETVHLLRRWREHCNKENPNVFHALPRYSGDKIDTSKPLNVREASRIFERVSRRAGLGKALSGHSARVGGAQDMTQAGMDLPAIMQAGRWKSQQMPARYAANELAKRVGRNRRAAIDKLRR